MASLSPEGDEVAEILRFAQDDRNPVCRESTTPPRPIRFAHRARHPSCPGVSSRPSEASVGKGILVIFASTTHLFLLTKTS